MLDEGLMSVEKFKVAKEQILEERKQIGELHALYQL
tara:strand:+ start:75 stop:182 length:108 start_codon:yes stop_codon:yes gene_type:complete